MNFTTLEQAFAYYTECQLATLETLQERKSTSKSDLRRQQNIVNGMVAECKVFKDCTTSFNQCPRLKEILKIQ